MDTIPLAEAKARLSAIADNIITTHDRIEVTRHGRRALVIMAAEDFDAYEDTVFWAGVPGIAETLAEADADIAAGRWHTTEQVKEWIAAGMPDDEPGAQA